jgi:hypothetical protein
MCARCCPSYWGARYYYDRGIRVHKSWRGSRGFERFRVHVGRPPTRAHSLDRIDNDRGYEPGNVRWATAKQQGRNKRSNKLITVNGISRTYSEWAEIAGVSRQCIRQRLARGWTPAEAVLKGPQHAWFHRESYRTKK